MQTRGIPPRESAVLREIKKFNRINSVGSNNDRQQRPHPRTFSLIQMEWMRTKKTVVLYVRATEKVTFEWLREKRNLLGENPSIIIAENPPEHKFTIWANDIIVLKKLRDEFNRIDGVSLEKFPQQGFNWAVVKSKRDGEFYLKSPYHSGGTTIFSRVVLRKIRVILNDIQYENRQARKNTQATGY